MLGDGFLLILRMANACVQKVNNEAEVDGTMLVILSDSKLDSTVS